MKTLSLLFLCLLLSLGSTEVLAQKNTKPLKALIIDGQNNHVQWPKITYMMKRYLEETGKFSVDVSRTYYTWEGDEYIKQYKINGVANTQALPKARMDSSYRPAFANYDVVICNFGWNAAPWSDATQADFEQFIKKGGGLVVIHAANNSFPLWPAYNRMIGLGGWGDRTEKDGPYVYYDQEGKLVRDTQAGRAGSHGAQNEFLITMRNTNHPITKGMPEKWMHTKDEMYDRLRGPAEEMEVLATAFSPKSNRGTERNEPMLMTIKYGKGRIFHVPLGHADYSVECVGFITCLQRGSQWAATGKVDIPIPADFPTAEKVSYRPFIDNTIPEIKLIVRSDDIGSSHTANRACMDVFTNGISRSVEIMAPTPWFLEAAKMLRAHPNYDVGIHLVMTSEWENIKWRPLTHAPSIVDADGYFPPFVWQNKGLPNADYLQKHKINLQEAEAELRAQIEIVKKYLPHASHLSCHMGFNRANDDLKKLVEKLSAEYKLPLEIPVKATYVQGFSGANKTPQQKEQDLVKILSELPAGTHFIIEHPGYFEGDMKGMSHKGYEEVALDREGVTQAFTSQAVKDVIAKRGIKLLSIKDAVEGK